MVYSKKPTCSVYPTTRLGVGLLYLAALGLIVWTSQHDFGGAHSHGIRFALVALGIVAMSVSVLMVRSWDHDPS